MIAGERKATGVGTGVLGLVVSIEWSGVDLER